MKRLLSLILCMSMTLAVCALNVSALGYGDNYYKFSHWAKEEGESAVISDLVSDWWTYEDLQAPVTRAEFCCFLWQLAVQMAGLNEQQSGVENLEATAVLSDAELLKDTAVQKFEDMDEFHGSHFVDAALNLGLINGVSETRFEPERAVTREEAAVMLHRLFNKFGYKTGKVDLSKYEDGKFVSDWAKDAVAALRSCEPFVSVLNNDEIIPHGTISREQVIVMRWRFYEEKYGKQDVLFYEESDPEILVELGLVSREDFAKGGNITVEEVLKISSELRHEAADVDYSLWYAIDDLAELDGLDEGRKRVLMELYDATLNPFFHYSDFSKVDFDADITYREAYAYMVRCVESSTDFVQYDMKVDADEVYSEALRIGLIDDADTKNANKPMPRQEFYELLHRAVFCEYEVYQTFPEDGSCAIERPVDLKRRELEEERNKKTYEINPENVELKVVPYITTDCFWQLSWDIPQLLIENSTVKDNPWQSYSYYTEYVFKDKTGKEMFRGEGSVAIRKIDDMERYLFGKYPEVPTVVCIKYVNYKTKDEYLLEIDLSNIEIVEEGELLTPDELLLDPAGSGIAKLSLKEGENFEKDCYYMLRGYEDKYRVDEYNVAYSHIFRATETGNIIDMKHPHRERWMKKDGVYLRKLSVEGNLKDGMKFTLTPESVGTFIIDYYRPWLEKPEKTQK